MRTIGLCLLLVATLLAGCGGGGSSSPPNDPPVALTGSGQTVVEQTAVILDGSGSTDSDGIITAYQWTQTSGPPVTISNGDQAQASFTAPIVSRNRVLVFQLLVTDNDNATATQTVAITARPALFFNLGGTIAVPAGTAVDGDVNDANASIIPNDNPSLAQIIPNPVTVGGYVNVPLAGEPGPSFSAGDISDYYRVSLIAGETITLVVADPAIGDVDLCLYSSPDELLLDCSLDTGTVESLIVPSNGEFLVEAFASSGASNYVLVIGQTQSAGSDSDNDLFICDPGEACGSYLTLDQPQDILLDRNLAGPTHKQVGR